MAIFIRNVIALHTQPLSEQRQLDMGHKKLQCNLFSGRTPANEIDSLATHGAHDDSCLGCAAVRLDKSTTIPEDASGCGFDIVAREIARRQFSMAKPYTILGSGRVDPFASYPAVKNDSNTYLHELIDHGTLVASII